MGIGPTACWKNQDSVPVGTNYHGVAPPIGTIVTVVRSDKCFMPNTSIFEMIMSCLLNDGFVQHLIVRDRNPTVRLKPDPRATTCRCGAVCSLPIETSSFAIPKPVDCKRLGTDQRLFSLTHRKYG